MKKYFFSAGLVVALSVFTLGSVAFADEFGLDATAGAAHLDKAVNSVPVIAGNIIGTLLSMISVLFFVLVLYGGILWMTARGNSEQTTKALDTIIAAVIGIIIIMGAYALTNFVFKLGGSGSGSSGGSDTAGTGTQGSCVNDESKLAECDVVNTQLAPLINVTPTPETVSLCTSKLYCTYQESIGSNLPPTCIRKVLSCSTNAQQNQCKPENGCKWQ